MIRVTWVTDKETIGPYHHPTDENGCFNSNWGYISASYHYCSAEDINEAEFGATLGGEFLVGRLRAVIIAIGKSENAVSTTLSFNISDIPDYAPWQFNHVDFGTVVIEGFGACGDGSPQP